MANLDTTWLLLDLVFLACGAVPALLALRSEREQQAVPRIVHERPLGLSPDQFRRSAAVLERMRHPA